MLILLRSKPGIFTLKKFHIIGSWFYQWSFSPLIARIQPNPPPFLAGRSFRIWEISLIEITHGLATW